MIDLHKITPLALSESMNSQLALQGMDGLFIPFHENLILEQFTGLHDWWEGDIFKHSGSIYVIEYKDGAFRFKTKQNTYLDLTKWTPLPEKIGNIHENPELLK